jgi:hypothetical protein
MGKPLSHALDTDEQGERSNFNQEHRQRKDTAFRECKARGKLRGSVNTVGKPPLTLSLLGRGLGEGISHTSCLPSNKETALLEQPITPTRLKSGNKKSP